MDSLYDDHYLLTFTWTRPTGYKWDVPTTPSLCSINSLEQLTDIETFYLLASRFIISSVQFSHSVVSNSLRPHELQHARIPCTSPVPRACPNSCSLGWQCHPTISTSAVPFSSCLLSFPALGSFPMNQFFTSGGQSIGASASDFPMNIQDWFPLG